jgi:hypothetical protein
MKKRFIFLIKNFYLFIHKGRPSYRRSTSKKETY